MTLNLNNVAVFDLDNTLFNVDHVLDPTTENGFKHFDWEGRKRSLHLDTVIYPVKSALEDYYWVHDYDIVIITSRPESLREDTEVQLHKFHIPYNKLYMAREADPHYANSHWKLDILKRIESQGNKITVIYEDIDENVSTFRRAGYTVFQTKQDMFTNRPRNVNKVINKC